MSHIAFITRDGVFLPFAIRCQEEGHKVSVYWDKKHPGTEYDRIGEGIIKTYKTLTDLVRSKPDAVVFDSTGSGKLADGLRRAGLSVYGASEVGDELEFDRDGSLNMVEAAGVKIPETHTFRTFPEAQAFLKKERDAYVIKLDGEKYAGSSLTFVAGSAEEAREVLNSYQKTVPGGMDIVLQKRLTGIEVTSEGYWDGHNWEDTFWNHTFEKKKFMNDDKGPNTGCSGDILLHAGRDRLVEQSIARLGPMLKSIGFRGQIDINTLVVQGEVYALELTPRFGINASITFMSTWQTGVGDWLVSVAKGGSSAIRVKAPVGASVTCSIPPYPGTKTDGITKNVPILIREAFAPAPVRESPPADKEDEKPFSEYNFFGVRKEGDHLVSVGFDGWVASPTGQGQTAEDAVRQAYQRVNQLRIPNVQYRTDIGKDVDYPIGSLRADKWIL